MMQLSFDPTDKSLVFTGPRADFAALVAWLETATDGEAFPGAPGAGPPDLPLAKIWAGSQPSSENGASIDLETRKRFAEWLAEVLDYNDESDFRRDQWHAHFELDDGRDGVELPSGRAAEILIVGPTALGVTS